MDPSIFPLVYIPIISYAALLVNDFFCSFYKNAAVAQCARRRHRIGSIEFHFLPVLVAAAVVLSLGVGQLTDPDLAAELHVFYPLVEQLLDGDGIFDVFQNQAGAGLVGGQHRHGAHPQQPLEQAPAGHMERTIETARQMGATVESLEEGIRVSMRGRPHPIRLETGPYPEFPTDMQSVMMAAASIADGTSRIQENVFENRFCVAKELQKLGAHIIIENKLAVVDGVNALKGTRVAAEDLRGGAALAVAALAADGTSFLDGYEHISRGYEDIRSDLAGAGARISLIG